MSAAVAQAIRGMMAAGLTLEQALLAIEKMDEAKRGTAKTNAERQAEFRARQKASRNGVTSNESNVTPVTPSRDIQNTPAHAEPEPNITTYPTTSEAKASSVEPPKLAKPKSDRGGAVSALAKVVGQDRAEAVVEHRAKIRKPLTTYAAERLATSLAKADDPQAAADLMIERGWQGYQPDWGRNDRAPPPRQAKRNTALDDLNDRAEGFFANVQHFPRIAG